MMILGITGGTGCGKTTLLDCILRRGGCVIDCDEVYHNLLEADETLLEAIDESFPGVVENGVFRRKKLGKLVFGNPAALLKLNALVHPFVHSAVMEILETAEMDGCEIAAIDAIALIESGIGTLCDHTIAVTAPRDARIARLMKREGIPRDYAIMRIDAQKENEAFRALCEYSIDNSYPSAAAFSAACDNLITEILGGNNNA